MPRRHGVLLMLGVQVGFFPLRGRMVQSESIHPSIACIPPNPTGPKTRQCVSSSLPSMRLSEMLRFKYQILVDGYSAAWDSSFWKLSSGSAVFYLIPLDESMDTRQVWLGRAIALPLELPVSYSHSDHCPSPRFLLQPWALWWYPMLSHGEHLIRTSATDLPLDLLKCLRPGIMARHLVLLESMLHSIYAAICGIYGRT